VTVTFFAPFLSLTGLIFGLILKKVTVTFLEVAMGKQVYTINGRMYIINEETGDIQTLHIGSEQIPPNDLKELIKILAKLAKLNEKE
jgi:hypothetical protein